MLKILAIMTGGGLGAACRYWLFLLVQRTAAAGFPAGTLAVNLLGCLLVGFLWSFFEGARLAHEWRLFIFTGFLGGFTTYSTFARETTQLFRAGEWKSGLLYLSVSNIGGLALVAAGYFLSRRLLDLTR
jgi:fluoride exporter